MMTSIWVDMTKTPCSGAVEEGPCLDPGSTLWNFLSRHSSSNPLLEVFFGLSFFQAAFEVDVGEYAPVEGRQLLQAASGFFKFGVLVV